MKSKNYFIFNDYNSLSSSLHFQEKEFIKV